jgi:ribosomal protein L36
MYSDDLWNLVYVNKSVNSSMSNRVKQDDVKDKLIKRNKKLLQLLDTKKITNKEVEELRLAINKDYVELFWIGHQG